VRLLERELRAARLAGRAVPVEDPVDCVDPELVVLVVAAVHAQLERLQALHQERVRGPADEVLRAADADRDRAQGRRRVQVRVARDPAALGDAEVVEVAPHALAPDVLAAEVGEVGVRIADALDERDIPVLPQLLDLVHRGMELVRRGGVRPGVQRERVALLDREARPPREVVRQRDRHDHVQGVVSAERVHDDEPLEIPGSAVGRGQEPPEGPEGGDPGARDAEPEDVTARKLPRQDAPLLRSHGEPPHRTW
jgi:hypothetical protein